MNSLIHVSMHTFASDSFSKHRPQARFTARPALVAALGGVVLTDLCRAPGDSLSRSPCWPKRAVALRSDATYNLTYNLCLLLILHRDTISNKYVHMWMWYDAQILVWISLTSIMHL